MGNHLCNKSSADNQDVQVIHQQTHVNNVIISLQQGDIRNSGAESLVLDHRVSLSDSSIQQMQKNESKVVVLMTNAGKYRFKKLFHVYWCYSKPQTEINRLEDTQIFDIVSYCLKQAESFKMSSICFTDLFDSSNNLSRHQVSIVILLSIKYNVITQNYKYLKSIEIMMRDHFQFSPYKSVFCKILSRPLCKNLTTEYSAIEQEVAMSSNSFYGSKIELASQHNMSF